MKTMLTAIEEGIEEGERNPSSLQASNEYFAFAKAFRMGIDYASPPAGWVSRMAPRRIEGIVVAAALAVLVLVAGGCGSGDDGDGGGAPPQPRMAKAQLAERLGDICQEHTDRQVIAVERFDREHGIPHGPAHEKATAAQLERELVQVILPIVRDTIRDVRDLRPPVEEEARFEAFVAALEHGVEASEDDPSWIATGATEPFMQARAASAALGTYYCGQA